MINAHFSLFSLMYLLISKILLSIGLINSLANLYVQGKLSLDQVKSQVEEKNYETLNRTIMQLNLRRNATQPNRMQ